MMGETEERYLKYKKDWSEKLSFLQKKLKKAQQTDRGELMAMSSENQPKAREDMNAGELWQDTDSTMGRAKDTAEMALQEAVRGREVFFRRSSYSPCTTFIIY